MGKAIPKAIKSRCDTLIEGFSDKFSKDFEANKKALNEMDLPFSKTERNLMAGYLVRLKSTK